MVENSDPSVKFSTFLFLTGSLSCNVTGNTYNSVLTVQVVSAGVDRSGCSQVGELLLGSLEGVHLDSGARSRPSRHHHCVLHLNGAGTAANKGIKTQMADRLHW